MVRTYFCLADKINTCFKRQSSALQIGPLSKRCQAGKIKICKVTGDRDLCARMAALGLTSGTEAELICPGNGSQCILKLYGCKVCLDHSISENILVSGS